MLRLTVRIEVLLLALALALPGPAGASFGPGRAALRDLSAQESQLKRTGLEEALASPAASGLEELRLEPEQPWMGTQGAEIGRIRNITRGAEVAGRVVYPDPARVRISSHWDEGILEDDFPQWQDPPAPLDAEQKERLGNTGRKPDQWRQALEGPGKEPLVLLTDSLQPDFQQPYCFLIADAGVVRQKYAREKYPLDAVSLRSKPGYDDAFCVFVLEPGPPRVAALRFEGERVAEELTGLTLQDGRPVGSGGVRDPPITHAISGVPLLLNGQDLSGQVRSNRVPQPREIRPNEVVWPTDRKAAFSAIGTSRGGPPILLSVTAHIGLGELAALMREAGMTDGILRQGSGGVLQWLAGESYPALHGTPDAASERAAEREVRPSNSILAGYERPPSAGLEEQPEPGREGIEEKIRRVDYIVQQMFETRKMDGLPVLEEPPGHVFKTPVDMYGPTEADEFIEYILPALGDPENILDLGHGIGHWVLMAAAARPKARNVWGIEYDPFLYEQSGLALQIAEEDGLIKRPGQVSFWHGDFYDPRFSGQFAKADLIRYFAGGTDDEQRLAEYLRVKAAKPGVRVLVNSEDPDPLPALASDGLFSREKVSPFTVVYTRRGSAAAAAGLEEGRVAVERITPEGFAQRFPRARWWEGARGAYLASHSAVSRVRFYAGHDTLWGQLQEWLNGERERMPEGMEVHLLRLPADAADLEAPGLIVKDWMLALPYAQQILPQLEAAVGEPLPSLPTLIIFALKGAGGRVEAVVGMMRLQDAEGRTVYAYFV